MSTPIRRWLVLAVLAHPPRAHAQTLPPGDNIQTLVSGLDAPCAFDFLPDGRVLFTEQNTGRVRVWSPRTGLQATPVLQMTGLVSGGERGLLGIAVDPAFPSKPFLYLFMSATGSHSDILRCQLTGDLTATGNEQLLESLVGRFRLLGTIPDNAPNHNGGTLRFAADGSLIASVGDDAFPCGAQDSTGLRGVLLRLDTSRLPSAPGTASIAQLTPADNPYATSPDSNARLVLVRGLRNPFRVQAEPHLPWLYVGDVGESAREEFDVIELPSALTHQPTMARPGSNLGWPYLEGTALGTHANECAPAPDPLVPPAYEYDRTQQSFGAAIVPAGWIPAIASGTGDLLQPVATLPTGWYISDYYTGAVSRLGIVANPSPHWEISPPVPGQASADHLVEGLTAISDWRVQGLALWFVRQSVGFAPNTGSIGILAADELPPPVPVPERRLTAALERVPAVAQATIQISDALQFPAVLTIHDASGRQRRRIETFGINAGHFFALWDGLDDDGAKVPAGLYWARLESAAGRVTVRVPFLR